MLRTVFKNKKAFIPFIMAGHPSMESSKQAIHALSKANVAIIELGVPFSDPVADDEWFIASGGALAGE